LLSSINVPFYSAQVSTRLNRVFNTAAVNVRLYDPASFEYPPLIKYVRYAFAKRLPDYPCPMGWIGSPSPNTGLLGNGREIIG
jgi:hypothetical protein